jgi:hypothetical protein
MWGGCRLLEVGAEGGGHEAARGQRAEEVRVEEEGLREPRSWSWADGSSRRSDRRSRYRHGWGNRLGAGVCLDELLEVPESLDESAGRRFRVSGGEVDVLASLPEALALFILSTLIP